MSRKIFYITKTGQVPTKEHWDKVLKECYCSVFGRDDYEDVYACGGYSYLDPLELAKELTKDTEMVMFRIELPFPPSAYRVFPVFGDGLAELRRRLKSAASGRTSYDVAEQWQKDRAKEHKSYFYIDDSDEAGEEIHKILYLTDDGRVPSWDERRDIMKGTYCKLFHEKNTKKVRFRSGPHLLEPKMLLEEMEGAKMVVVVTQRKRAHISDGQVYAIQGRGLEMFRERLLDAGEGVTSYQVACRMYMDRNREGIIGKEF